MEEPNSGGYLRRMGHIVLLGELYNYKLVDSRYARLHRFQTGMAKHDGSDFALIVDACTPLPSLWWFILSAMSVQNEKASPYAFCQCYMQDGHCWSWTIRQASQCRRSQGMQIASADIWMYYDIPPLH